MFDKKTKIFMGFIGILFIIVMAFLILELQKLENLKVGTIDLNQVEDGVYYGTESTYLIEVEVIVTIKNHNIEDVQLLTYRHSRGEDAVLIIEDMVKENKVMVDNISGATESSRVIKAAVIKALKGQN